MEADALHALDWPVDERRGAMNFNNIIWVVFLFLFLQPILAAQYLKAMRAGKFAAIQRSRKSRLIAAIHRGKSADAAGPEM